MENKNIHIITTVIPVGVSNGTVKFNLLLSPRLLGDASSKLKLSDFPEVFEWQNHKSVMDNVTFTFFDVTDVKKAAPSMMPAKPLIRINPGDNPDRNPELNTPIIIENLLWKSVFMEKTPVNPWRPDTPFIIAQAQTNEQITEEVIQGIDDCIEKLLDEPLDLGPYKYVTDPQIGSDMKNSFILYLEQLKKMSIEKLLNDPLLDYTYHPWMQPLFTRLTDIKKSYEKILAQTVLNTTFKQVEENNSSEINEFHKKLSGFTSHPFFLKRTGWLWEFELPLDAVNNSTSALGGVLAVSAAPTKTDINSKILFVPVLTGVNKSDWTVADTPQKAEKEQTFWLINAKQNEGYIQVASQNGEGLQYGIDAYVVDVHQVLQKVSDRVNYQLGMKVDEGKGEDYHKDLHDFLKLSSDRDHVYPLKDDEALVATGYDLGRFSEYHNNGITLSVTGFMKLLKTAITNNATNNADTVFYRDNLIQGYRVDVLAWNGRTNTPPPGNSNYVFGSLCRRIEEYHSFDEKLQKWMHLTEDKGEGWIAETVQGTNENNTYILEERLSCWNGDSLVCSPVDVFEDPEEVIKKHHSQVQLDCSLLDTLAYPASQKSVPLRLGWSYRFAVRPVFIDGSSQSRWKLPDNASAQAAYQNPVGKYEGCLTTACKYERVESILSPIVMFGTQVYDKLYNERGELNETRKWIECRTGEDETTLVVRSRYDGKALIFDNDADISSMRFLAPPQATYDFVLQHGVLDAYLSASTTGKKNEYAKLKQLHNFQPGGLADTFKTGDPTPAIRHLYDPLADGFEISIDGVVRRFYNGYAKYINLMGATPPKYFAIALQPVLGSDLTEAATRDTYTIGLGPGMEKSAVISCLMEQKYMEDTTDQLSLFMAGVPKFRRKTLKMIHAVQKPCLLGGSYPGVEVSFLDNVPCNSITIERTGGVDTAILNVAFDRFPVLTSDTYSLYVEYIDLVCDRTTTTGSRAVKVIRLINKNVSPADILNEANVKFSVEHAFVDNPGRYRRANYKIIAESKFKKFFPESVNEFSIEGITTPVFAPMIEKAISYKTYKSVLAKAGIVKSTIKPAAVEIERIVPMITFERSEDAIQNIVKRSCKTVRVYLKGDWFSTGAEEKIAVLFMTDKVFNSSNTLIVNDRKTVSMATVTSQFGEDPAADTVSLSSDTLRRTMTTSTDQYDKFFSTTEFETNIPLTDLEFDPFESNGVDLGKLNLSAAIYDVSYDKQNGKNGQFYVDIDVNQYLDNRLPDPDPTAPKNYTHQYDHYSPLVRFAIARYQPNATDRDAQHPGGGYKGYMFSKVALTDFCPILHRRQVEWSKSGEPKMIHTSPHMAIRKNKAGNVRTEIYGVYMSHDFSELSDSLLLHGHPAIGSFPKDQLHQFHYSPAKAGKYVLPAKDGESIPDTTDQVLILEYEVYKDNNREPDENIITSAEKKKEVYRESDGSIDPTSDYTRRLVFSYLVDFAE